MLLCLCPLGSLLVYTLSNCFTMLITCLLLIPISSAAFVLLKSGFDLYNTFTFSKLLSADFIADFKSLVSLLSIFTFLALFTKYLLSFSAFNILSASTTSNSFQSLKNDLKTFIKRANRGTYDFCFGYIDFKY